MKLQNRSFNYLARLVVLLMAAPGVSFSGDIKPSVEVEFNLFYNRNYPRPFSFQFREAKLFLDTYINENSTALIEFTMKDNLQRGELERAYFTQQGLPLNSQLNLASRLVSQAKPGEILVSEATYDLVKEQFVCSTLGKIPVKGKSEPVEIFLITSET